MSAIRLLPTRTAANALLALDGPGAATWNTIIEATDAYEGPAGNAITVASVADGTWVACAGTLTLVANPVADETVTIDTTVYTWVAAADATAFEVEIGATASDSLDNLIAAINLAAGAGTVYGSATTEHPTVRAYAGAGDTMVVHSRPEVLAAAGTLIATTDGMANAGNVWGAATLGDGTDGTNVTFEVSGTAITIHYASGFSTVEDFEAAMAASADVSALVSLKTAGTTPLYRLVVTDDDWTAVNLTGGGATSSAAPALTDATAGMALPHLTDEALLILRNVDNATGTTKTATGTLWGFSKVTSSWYPIGAVAGGATIAEAASDKLAYVELIVGLRRFTRVYFQIGALGGAGTEVEVWLDCVPADTTTS